MNEQPTEVKHQSTPSNASTIIGSTINNSKKIGVMDNSIEGFDVFQITKKIQEQTRSIEDEIKKVAELLRKQQENSIQKSISKQTLNKDYLTNRHSMHKNSTPMPAIGEHSSSIARHAHSLEPIGADQYKNNRSMPEKINLSKQFNQTPQNVIGSQFSTIEKGGNSRLKNPTDELQVSAQRSSEQTYNDSSIKSKRRLKEKEIEIDQIPVNLNVQIMPQTQKRGELGAGNHDINKQRDKFFSGNKHDLDNLPNNTFHKLFNGQTEQQIGGPSNIPHLKNNSPHSFIQNEEIRIPNQYGESPHQIVKSKARRIAQASNDRRGGATESLPNPQNIRESLELQNLGKGLSNEALRIPGQNKQFKNSKHQLEALNHDNSQHIKAYSESQLKKLQQNDPNAYNNGTLVGGPSNQMQQKVAMNNFLTPIVFVSNNYHGVQPRVAPNNDYQEFVGEYDQNKGLKQKHGQVGYPNPQALNRDIMFEPDSNYNPQQNYNNNQTYFPPLNSHNLYRPLSKHHNPLNNRLPHGNQVSTSKHPYRQQQQQQQTSLRQEFQDVLSDHGNNPYDPQGQDSQLQGGNLAGAQARLGALMQKMPMNALNQQYSQNSPSPGHGENSKRNKQDGKMGKMRRQSALRGGGPAENTMNEDEEQMDTVGELAGNQNNIFYQSIHVDLPDDRTMQDQQMRQYCQNLELYIQTANSKLDLIMNRIRLNHPIFKMISASTFSYIVERSFLFKLQNNYGAYQEGYRAMNNLYFVLYGDISLMKKGQGQIGQIMTMGYTLGEEILFSERDPIVRQESCLCTHPEGSALLQINVDDFIKLGVQKHLMLGRGGKDFKVLMGILQNNFEMKQQWREQQQAVDNKSSGGNRLPNR